MLACRLYRPVQLPLSHSTVPLNLTQVRFASKKAGGSSAKQKSRPVGKRLGLKVSGGARCNAGNILIRQRGQKTRPGLNTHMGRDFTIHASVKGIVHFTRMGRPVPPWLSGDTKRFLKFIHVIEPGNDETAVHKWMRENEEYYQIRQAEKKMVRKGHFRASLQDLQKAKYLQERREAEELEVAARMKERKSEAAKMQEGQ
eukprot:g51153.t1